MEVKVGSFNYRIGKIDAFQQFEVVRRYSGVLLALSGLEEPEKGKPVPTAQNFVKAMVVFARPVPKEDCDYVNAVCLSKVQRQETNGVGWQNVIAGSGQLMYEDITMPQLLELVWHVMKENRLTDFFASAPASSEATSQQGSI